MGTVACTRAAPLPFPLQLPSLSEDRDLLYIFTSIFRFTKLSSTNFLYIFGGTVEDYYAFGAGARARTPRRNVDVLRFATTPCERVPRYLFYTLLHSLSLFFFLLFFSVSWISLYSRRHRTYYYTDEAKRWNRSQGFFFILVIFIFISIIFIYFYMYYLIIFFSLKSL